jgi:hypothetical protein
MEMTFLFRQFRAAGYACMCARWARCLSEATKLIEVQGQQRDACVRAASHFGRGIGILQEERRPWDVIVGVCWRTMGGMDARKIYNMRRGGEREAGDLGWLGLK